MTKLDVTLWFIALMLAFGGITVLVVLLQRGKRQFCLKSLWRGLKRLLGFLALMLALATLYAIGIHSLISMDQTYQLGFIRLGLLFIGLICLLVFILKVARTSCQHSTAAPTTKQTEPFFLNHPIATGFLPAVIVVAVTSLLPLYWRIAVLSVALALYVLALLWESKQP